MFMNRTLLRILNSGGLRVKSKFNTKSNDLLMMHKNRCQSMKLWFQKYLNSISNYQIIIIKVLKHEQKSIKIWIKKFKIWKKVSKYENIIEDILYKKMDLLIFLSWSMILKLLR